MKGIGELIKKLDTPEKAQVRSEKGEIIKELYALYTSCNARKHRKADNWKAFRTWLIDHGEAITKVTVMDKRLIEAFKKSKGYIVERTVPRFAIGLSKHNKAVLYEILSIAKDKDRRGENTGAYIGSNFWKFTNQYK